MAERYLLDGEELSHTWSIQEKTVDATSPPRTETPRAGLSPKSNSGGQNSTPQATSSAFITNFPDNPKKICIKDPAAQGAVKHHGEIYFSFDRVFWTECTQEEIFQVHKERPLLLCPCSNISFSQWPILYEIRRHR